jgi:DNA-binding response OmpR family regulator
LTFSNQNLTLKLGNQLKGKGLRQTVMNKILVVEDNIALCKFYGRVLDQTGVHVTQTNSCQAALDYLDQDVPALILLDLRLPDGSGQLIIDYIKSHPTHCATHIVVISAETHSKSESLHRSVDKVITKPVSTWGLLDMVKEFGLARATL